MHITYYYLFATIGFLSVMIGLGFKFGLDWLRLEQEITWTEFAVVSFVIISLLAPGGTLVGWNLAKADLLSFNQNINTRAVGYQIIETTCTQDGVCRNTYACDSYPCQPHDCNCTCTSRDNNGNCTSQSCLTCYNTCWRSCPYCTKEWTAVIHTDADSFMGGPVVLASGVLPKNPDTFRWRSTVSIPADLPVDAPETWYSLRGEIQSSPYAPSITRRDEYTGYTLAVGIGNAEEYQADIQKLIQLGLMPMFKTGLEADGISSDRVYFVGWKPENQEDWYNTHEHLVSALGMELQGDLHVVIMNVAGHDLNPDRILYSIKHDWQDKKKYKDNVFGKNAILVVVATRDNKTVAWMRATTGMPEDSDVPIDYNADMRAAIATTVSTPGQNDLTPEAVLGFVRTEYKSPIMVNPDPMYGRREVGEVVHVHGLVSQVVFGLINPKVAFQRVSMAAKDPGDIGDGFLKLEKLIIPTVFQQILIVISTIAITLVAWGVVIFWNRSYRQVGSTSIFR